MKSLIIPILLFALAISFIVCVERAADSTLSELIRLTESLPDTADGSEKAIFDEIEKKWNRHKTLYSAVTKLDLLNGFEKELAYALSGALTGDNGTYVSSKNAMITTLEYLRSFQKLRLKNLL